MINKIRQFVKEYFKLKKILFFYFVFLISSFLFAQNAAVTTIGSVINAVSGNTTVPITVKGFNNIGGFTLTIKFDTTRVRFISATSNPLLNGMTITYFPPSGSTQGKLLLAWSAASNLSLSEGSNLANLTFSYVSSTGLLSWAYTYGSVCQYKTYNGTSLVVMNDSLKYPYYINGGISNRAAPLTYAPSIPSPVTGALTVPVTVSDFSNIGALTLYLEYDTTVLSYQNSFTKNAAFNSNFLVGNISSTGTKKYIIIQWYGTGLTLTNGSTLCILNFTYLSIGNSCPLKWFDNGPSCEYADGSGNVLIDSPTSNYYTNGLIGTGIKIKGQLTYDNNYSTPLNAVIIQLVNNLNQVVATTTTTNYTDNSIPANPILRGGYYEFSNLNSENYILRAFPTISWGGVNSTDALYIIRHTIGVSNLTGLSLKAADVNLSNYINSTDALVLQLRTIGNSSQFVSGDWVYADTTVTAIDVTTHNFKVLATGDVNRSYIPVSSKALTFTNLQKEGVVYVDKNQEIELPVTVSDALNLGAITLDLLYDNNLVEVNDITSELKGLKFNITKGKVIISWFDYKEVNFQPNDVLLTLKVKVKNDISSTTDLFSYSNNTEFSDGNGQPLNFNIIKTRSIETNLQYANINIYPNPFKDKIAINYNLPFDGMVKLKLYNYTGSCVIEQVNEIQHKGNHSLNLDVSNLAFGIYMATLSLKNGENEFFKIIKIVK